MASDELVAHNTKVIAIAVAFVFALFFGTLVTYHVMDIRRPHVPPCRPGNVLVTGEDWTQACIPLTTFLGGASST